MELACCISFSQVIPQRPCYEWNSHLVVKDGVVDEGRSANDALSHEPRKESSCTVSQLLAPKQTRHFARAITPRLSGLDTWSGSDIALILAKPGLLLLQ